VFCQGGIRKVEQSNERVLSDILLSFSCVAQSGVLGNHGPGKGTLLHIIDGEDEDYLGEIPRQKGITFGMLPQEPTLDPDKTVKDIVEEGVQETIDLLAEYEEVNAAFGEPDADFEKLIAKQERLQDKIDQADAWDIDSKLEQAM